MKGVPVDLGRVHRCRARFRRLECPPYEAVWMHIGQLPDGRWWTWLVGVERRATAWPDEQTALQAARRAMAEVGPSWEQVPCYPTQGWQVSEQDYGSSGFSGGSGSSCGAQV